MASIGLGSQEVSLTRVPERQHVVDLEQLITEEIEKLPTKTPDPCIFMIPQNLRDRNPKAYTPGRVAIGPYHADAERMKSMEPHKLRYLVSLMSRSGGRSKLKDYIAVIEKRESEAWECYSGIEDLRNKFDSQKFKRMLLLDGAFIVEFFCRGSAEMIDNTIGTDAQVDDGFSINGDDVDPVSNTDRIQGEICQDLILLENQLPFFILEGLFDCTFSGEDLAITLSELGFTCLRSLIPLQSSEDLPLKEVRERTSQERVMHLVHLMRICCLDVPGENPSKTVPTHSHSLSMKYCCCGLPISCICSIECGEPLPALQSCGGRNKDQHHVDQFRYSISITELHEAGIHFKRAEKGKFIHIKFDQSQGVVEIPHLDMTDTTETFLRNVIAFEQYHLNKFHITNYVSLMEGLVDTTKDVQILEESHVIENLIESKKDIVNFFNNITKGTIFHYPDEYMQMCNELTAYIKKPWNKWKATLRRDYFGSPWAIISLIAAVVLLGLTIVQTIATVRSTNWH